MSADSAGGPDHAEVIAPPPLIFASVLLAGIVLDRMAAEPTMSRTLSRPAGFALLAAGVALFPPSFAAMRAAGTTVDPYEPTSAIIATGPYGYTRNPLYLGMGLIYTGIALLVRAPVALALLPGTIAFVRRGVIDREERYLTRKFGNPYLAYKARVPRWLFI